MNNTSTTTEGDAMVSPADPNDDQRTGIPGGLYVLVNKKARTYLDLCAGKSERARADSSMTKPPLIQGIRLQALLARAGYAVVTRKLTTSSG